MLVFAEPIGSRLLLSQLAIGRPNGARLRLPTQLELTYFATALVP